MLRDNRKFQFAVGVTAIVIVIRWLLTGDLLMAVEAARPPAEGETKSLTVLSVVGPMLIEACVIIGPALIAWALKLWDFMVALVDQAHQVRDSPARSPVVDTRTIASSSPAHQLLLRNRSMCRPLISTLRNRTLTRCG